MLEFRNSLSPNISRDRYLNGTLFRSAVVACVVRAGERFQQRNEFIDSIGARDTPTLSAGPLLPFLADGVNC